MNAPPLGPEWEPIDAWVRSGDQSPVGGFITGQDPGPGYDQLHRRRRGTAVNADGGGLVKGVHSAPAPASTAKGVHSMDTPPAKEVSTGDPLRPEGVGTADAPPDRPALALVPSTGEFPQSAPPTIALPVAHVSIDGVTWHHHHPALPDNTLCTLELGMDAVWSKAAEVTCRLCLAAITVAFAALDNPDAAPNDLRTAAGGYLLAAHTVDPQQIPDDFT